MKKEKIIQRKNENRYKNKNEDKNKIEDKNEIIDIETTSKENKNKTIIKTLMILLFAFTLLFSINWLYTSLGNLTVNEIVFQLKVPLKGTGGNTIAKYFIEAVPKIIGTTLSVAVIILIPFKANKKSIRASVIVLCVTMVYAINVMDVKGYIKSQIEPSTFIEEEYISTASTNIEFPEEKRNLIYIYMESMECSYYSKELGGTMDINLIPELAKLAQENFTFSSSNKLTGAHTLIGSTWTTGAMVAQTAGLPLKIGIDQNAYGQYTSFLPGVTNLGDILETAGYNQMLMIGSDVEFGGRQNLFEQHGDFEIWDLYTAIGREYMTEDDIVWWGYDDQDLYKYAKEQLSELSKKDKPFNFTMLTADTHFMDGYLCSNCKEKYESQYSNVIACASEQVGNFVKWIQNQDFYENTTIIISGDHLTMDNDYIKSIDENYDRTVLNIIINSPIETENNKNRKFSTFDMFPTTLAALNVKIDGNKLGLGVNLFSEEETLIEKYDIDYVEQELNKVSKFYNNNFIYNR